LWFFVNLCIISVNIVGLTNKKRMINNKTK
jgi:hypothetical protein